MYTVDILIILYYVCHIITNFIDEFGIKNEKICQLQYVLYRSGCNSLH